MLKIFKRWLRPARRAPTLSRILISSPTPPAGRVEISASPQKDPPMSWLSKYVFDPIKKDIANPGTAEAAATTATVTNAQATLTSALGGVNPLLDDLTSGVEGLLDSFLAKAGVAGQIGTPVANLAISLASSTAKAAIDAKLGIPVS